MAAIARIQHLQSMIWRFEVDAILIRLAICMPEFRGGRDETVIRNIIFSSEDIFWSESKYVYENILLLFTFFP